MVRIVWVKVTRVVCQLDCTALIAFVLWFYQIITYIRVPMRCARTAVGQCTDRSPWVRLCGEELFNLCVFDRFCHGKLICLFILFLLLRGRVPLILFRPYGLNSSVVVTSHCAQPNKRLQDVSWVVFSFGITCFIPIYGLDFRIFHGLLFVWTFPTCLESILSRYF